eukprot:3752084-Rhodomonas_salina.1
MRQVKALIAVCVCDHCVQPSMSYSFRSVYAGVDPARDFRLTVLPSLGSARPLPAAFLSVLRRYLSCMCFRTNTRPMRSKTVRNKCAQTWKLEPVCVKPDMAVSGPILTCCCREADQSSRASRRL